MAKSIGEFETVDAATDAIAAILAMRMWGAAESERQRQSREARSDYTSLLER